MKILCIGDIVGKTGRDAITHHLAALIKKRAIDFTIINVENASHGYGVAVTHCEEFFRCGADVLTTGNHIWDRKDILPYLDREKRLLRPHNYPRAVPGRGWGLFESKRYVVGVANIIGRIGMHGGDDPFQCARTIIDSHRLGRDANAIIVDFHAEATSEKMAMGHFLDGKVSAVFGTHTHVPTADTRILTGGTAFQTDIGMTGDYDSVIGMDKTTSVRRFCTGISHRLEPADKEATISGLYIETDDRSGRATRVEPILYGGVLHRSD